MIYLDNNATTKPIPEAIQAFLEVPFANPHQTYKLGLEAEKYLEKSKEIIAKCMNCDPEEVYFTGSATEACNWAIQILREKKCNLIYKEYEHSAVMKSIYAFEEKYENIPKERNGYIQMLVQNIYGEIFTVPQRENENDLIFMDATAAAGHMPINFKAMGIDLLAFGAHKFNGIRGAGCLIIRKELTPIRSIIWGGDVTGGTPAPALAWAMASALKWNCDHMLEHSQYIIELRDYMIDELLNINHCAGLNGPRDNRASNNINVAFSFIDGKKIMERLADEYNICISTGSACSADDYISKSGGICVRQLNAEKNRKKRVPEVITIFEAGGLNSDYATNSIRITLGFENTKEECQETIERIQEIIKDEIPF